MQTAKQPEIDPAELSAAVKSLYDNISTALSTVFAEVSRQLGTVLQAYGFALKDPRPTPTQLGEIGRSFNGKYATVGEAFQSLQESTQAVATTKWLLLVSNHNLNTISRWHVIRRWRLHSYIAELEAVQDGKTGK